MDLHSDFHGQSLEDWLSYLETVHSRAIDPTLDRMLAVAGDLDLSPLKQSRIVTVTGTNGKGSVTGLLAALLSAEGHSCNLYNSPHLMRFHERITLQGRPVSTKELLSAFEELEEIRRRRGVTLTFFEFTTLAAFMIFSRQPAEFLILEVGMGGRFDSVNILDAEVAVITNVALDHCAYLGDTREEIAYQKAGILKKGGVMVYGEADMPQSARKVAEELASDLLCRGRDYDLRIRDGVFDWQDLREPARSVEGIPLPTVPAENAATVLAALSALRIFPEPGLIRRVILDFAMPGRFQKIQEHPPVYADVGHNPHAFRYLVSRIRKLREQEPELEVILVIGMLRDKDYTEALYLISQEAVHLHLCTLYGPRGETGEKLAQAARSFQNCQVSSYNSVQEGLKAALAEASGKKCPLVLAAGSFLTVQAVLSVLGRES